MATEDAQRFLRALTAEDDDEPLSLTAVCRRATGLLSMAGAAVVLMADGASASVACAYGVTVTVQDLELMLGEGPAGDAYAKGHSVLVPDLALAIDRWPEFARAGAVQGIRALFALPLQFGAAKFGVLVLYQDRPHVLEDDEYASAILLAELVSSLVLDLQAGASVDSLADGLLAHDHRAVLHQATGMVAVQLGAPVSDALVRLRAHAFASGRPIDEVATDVVDRRLRFDRA